jgi:hypothetical protein
MNEPLLNLHFSEGAEDQISTLGEIDRRRVTALCNDLRNWHIDESVRKLAHRVPSMENAYLLRTSSDWRIGFQLSQDTVTILSIFRKETNRAFELAGQGHA